ncbi:Uncharacterised protein [uncultured Clostridium sp.]|uniref:hypothetical protein n=1 Tax=uncultured Clostridium sp. TaxID=59620 RepID=UPI000820F5AB|nr:hypothetical protein [uncultured Clostridium sp.]SCJ00914.1 Uncharacterised protein [uncultured Clostridium sp.]
MEEVLNSEEIIEEQRKNKKRYFMVFVCMLMQAIPYCIAVNLQGQMQTRVVKESGFISSIAFTMIYFSGTIPVLFNPIFNKLYEKISIKKIYVIGLIIGIPIALAFKECEVVTVAALNNKNDRVIYEGL